MIKSNELSSDNSSNLNNINHKRAENKDKSNNKIINKIHSIKASINNNNNNNKLKFIRRKNNFRRGKDINSKKDTSKSKNKSRKYSLSQNKNFQKNKIKENEKQNKEHSNVENINNKFYNCSLTEQNNLEKKNYYKENNPNDNRGNNNIIITINNYNKITPANFVQATIEENKPNESSNIAYKKINKANKKDIQENKKGNQKTYNCYINGNNIHLENNQNNIYNNNIFYNQLIFNKNNNNAINNINSENNIDSLSINTYNTINDSNNFINSSNNTTNREYNNKNFIKKKNKYQDNIILKKKQLEMYSPLSFLKKNFEINNTKIIELKQKEKENLTNLNSVNNSKAHSKFNSTPELDINEKNKANESIINKIEKNLKNKIQVSNIVSTLNRIKNTKQLYKNKKVFDLTRMNKKNGNPSINSKRNVNSVSKYKPFGFSNNSFNERLYYSRSKSKNVLSKNFCLKYNNFSNKESSKSNKKLIGKSFISERESLNLKKKRSNNDVLLSYNRRNDKYHTLNSLKNSSNNIRTGINREKTEINDSTSINTSLNDIKNSPVLSPMKNTIVNETNTTNIKNRNINTPSISAYLNTSMNNKIIDTYESNSISNINKHCDSLVSKIFKQIREQDVKINKDIKKEVNLAINKRIIANASICRKGLNRPDEEIKINQDNLFKVKFGDLNYSYYGVCDGHGPYGHLVSEFIKSNISFIVYKDIKSLLLQKYNINDNNSKSNLNDLDDSFIDFEKLFKDCFLLMESKLIENKSINIELSGTTCVSLLFCDDRIISSNIGDSRAIKGFYNQELKKFEYIALSRDHKPSEKDEAERIKNCKGIIHPYIDDNGKYAGPDRVWNEGEELPGLAMSRSFGDEIASKVGVFSEPEVKIFNYNKDDKFVVIASDGLWEYVTNDEVIDIVGKFHEQKDCDGAVSKLYEISKERWIKYDDYIDDISIIVVFLDDTK